MEAQSKNDSEPIPTVNVTDGREALPKFWIAVYTRPRSEKKVSKELSKLGIDNYVPTQTILRQWSDRKKKVDIVVIPNIVFVHLTNETIQLVKRHPLIVKIINFPGQRTFGIIPESQIERLKYMLNEADLPITFVSTEYQIDNIVRVKRGHLKGLIGAVERISTNKSRLIVSVDMLGGAMVEIDNSDLEIISKEIIS